MSQTPEFPSYTYGPEELMYRIASMQQKYDFISTIEGHYDKAAFQADLEFLKEPYQDSGLYYSVSGYGLQELLVSNRITQVECDFLEPFPSKSFGPDIVRFASGNGDRWRIVFRYEHRLDHPNNHMRLRTYIDHAYDRSVQFDPLVDIEYCPSLEETNENKAFIETLKSLGRESRTLYENSRTYSFASHTLTAQTNQFEAYIRNVEGTLADHGFLDRLIAINSAVVYSTEPILTNIVYDRIQTRGMELTGRLVGAGAFEELLLDQKIKLKETTKLIDEIASLFLRVTPDEQTKRLLNLGPAQKLILPLLPAAKTIKIDRVAEQLQTR
jgi:hypothetical protein